MTGFEHGVLHDSIFFINRREAKSLFDSKVRIVHGVSVLAMKDTLALPRLHNSQLSTVFYLLSRKLCLKI